MHLFPDTHFFLHYKSAQDIAWSEVTDRDEVRLVVGRAVAKELDRKKFELRGRPQERARSVVSKLGTVASGTSLGVLRDKAPRIVLEMAPERPAGWAPPADLDPAWGDDVLLSDVLAFRHGHPGADVALLTGDPGLMAKARAHGVALVSLLDRGWELAEEKTPEQKEVEKLRREVHDLRQIGPSIACELLVGDEARAALDLEFVRHPSLSDDVVDELLSGLKLKHPKVVEFPCPASPDSREPGTQLLDMDDPAGPTAWTAPEPDEVDAYLVDYDRWVGEAESFIRAASASFVSPPLDVLVRVELRNDGSGPAEGVQLRIEGRGGFLVSAAEGMPGRAPVVTKPAEAEPARLRQPPRPPRWRRGAPPPSRVLSTGTPAHLAALLASQSSVRGLSVLDGAVGGLGAMERIAGMSNRFHDLPNVGAAATLSGLVQRSPLAGYGLALSRPPLSAGDDHLRLPKPQDRHRFYPCETDASRKKIGLGFECDEFRHRVESRSFELRLAWDTDEGMPRSGAVWVRLSARNMREPFESTIPVRVTTVRADVRRLVAELLP